MRSGLAVAIGGLLLGLLVAPAVCARVAPLHGAQTADADCPQGPLESQFRAGRYKAVVSAAKGAACAEALALAARALLAQGAFLPPGDERAAILESAVAFAERALAVSPDHVDALLQAAAAYGFRGAERRSVGDVRRARRLLERAEELAPENPFVLAAIGTWHARTRLGAGALFAPLVFGATKDAARRYFARALEHAPDEAAIALGAGLLLVAFGGRDITRGLALLEAARRLAPRDAFTAALAARAGQLLRAAQKGVEGRALKQIARALQPYAERDAP